MVVFWLGLPKICTPISNSNFNRFQYKYVGSQSNLSSISYLGPPWHCHLDRAPKPQSWQVVETALSIPEGFTLLFQFPLLVLPFHRIPAPPQKHSPWQPTFPPGFHSITWVTPIVPQETLLGSGLLCLQQLRVDSQGDHASYINLTLRWWGWLHDSATLSFLSPCGTSIYGPLLGHLPVPKQLYHSWYFLVLLHLVNFI